MKVCRPFDHHIIAILASNIARLRFRGRVPGNREPSGPPDYDRWRGLQPAARQERAVRRERRRVENILRNMENAFMITIEGKPYHKDGPVRNADTKSPCCLPQRAYSPLCSAGLLGASNHLICFVLSSISEALFQARSRFLPALREGGAPAGGNLGDRGDRLPAETGQPSPHSSPSHSGQASYLLSKVRAARDAGFASLWFPHHWLTHPLQMLQVTPLMGYVAAHAQGMTIGPNILILPPLNPVHVAEETATLDVLTGGNYILGVGLGYRQPEFDASGISLKDRAPRFNESITLMRRLWTEDRVSHKGRFYTVNDAGISVKPVRPGGPPLYIAGQADVSVKRAARIGDAWLIVNTGGLGKVGPLMQTYRAALKEYGRAPMDFPITVECYVGARHATAYEECQGPLEYKYTTPMRPGDWRTAPRRVRSRISRATGSSSATRGQ